MSRHLDGSPKPAHLDPDAIGPDGTVRLRCYLPMANSLWFFAGCQGRQGCGHSAPIGVRAALRIMGSGEATVGELNRVHFGRHGFRGPGYPSLVGDERSCIYPCHVAR